jgi:hypothetical protein
VLASTNIMVALSSGVRGPSIKPFKHAVMRTIPRGWRRWVPNRRPQRVFDEFICWDIHQFNAVAREEISVRRAYTEEVSTCELPALLPGPKAEMFHGNRQRLVDVVARRERAYGNVTVVTVWKPGSRAEPIFPG